MGSGKPLVERHRAALSRVTLSRPIERAADDQLIRAGAKVLDYGCGRGDDVARLRALGIDASGYDPAFFPDTPLITADVVNLGYVVNVIENAAERADALRRAHNLARGVLIVSARLASDSKRLRGDRFADGVVTTSRTFQKVYTQEELRQWIDSTLHVASIAAAPGVFYVFRDSDLEQEMLAARARRRLSAPSVRLADALFDAHRDVLNALAQFLQERGRLPRQDEHPSAEAAREAFGSTRRAFAVLRRVTGEEVWQGARLTRYEDTLVYVALARFSRRRKLSELPLPIQYDIKEFFGSYKAALAAGERLLFAAGDPERVAIACRAARVGKHTPSSLYVHVSAVGQLPSLLRVYKGCADVLLGVVDGATIIKLSFERPQVSYLAYPEFDRLAHPELCWSMYAHLGHLRTDFRDYSEVASPPVLHRKEDFVGHDYPGRDRFARLTRQEIRAGLFADPLRIGNRRQWRELLDAKGLHIRGHRLQRSAGTQ